MIEDLYARHSRAVYRRARQLLGEIETARDVTHDVFVRVMRSGHPPPPQATAWLYRVTTNLCLNHLRDISRRRFLLATSFAPTESAMPMGETRVTLATIFEHLPVDTQDIAVYHFIDQLTYDEIAALTGVSRRTVGKRLASFRETVKRI